MKLFKFFSEIYLIKHLKLKLSHKCLKNLNHFLFITIYIYEDL